MTCAACAKAAERAVKKLDGVLEANVNFATEKLYVSYDESKVTIENIKQAIAKAGYEAQVEITEKNAIIPIQGMTCAACASRIEKVVSKLEGVLSVSVNLAAEKATVKYIPSRVRISEIKQAIAKAGYKALDVENKQAIDEDKIRNEKEIRTLWIKFIGSAVFSVPLCISPWCEIPGLNWSIPWLDPCSIPCVCLTELAW